MDNPDLTKWTSEVTQVPATSYMTSTTNGTWSARKTYAILSAVPSYVSTETYHVNNLLSYVRREKEWSEGKG